MTSSSQVEAGSQTTKPRRGTWRFFVGVLVACVGLFLYCYVRGAWGAAAPTYPTRPDEGVVTQLIRSKTGGNEIHTAIVIPVAIDAAWSILSDYDQWERLFKTVLALQAEQLNDNHYHVVSDVVTPLGTIKLDFNVTHEKTNDGGYVAWWDAPNDVLTTNRGEIRVMPQGPHETLVVYVIEKRYEKYPQFFVYNVLYDHQADLAETLGTQIQEIAKER